MISQTSVKKLLALDYLSWQTRRCLSGVSTTAMTGFATSPLWQFKMSQIIIEQYGDIAGFNSVSVALSVQVRVIYTLTVTTSSRSCRLAFRCEALRRPTATGKPSITWTWCSTRVTWPHCSGTTELGKPPPCKRWELTSISVCGVKKLNSKKTLHFGAKKNKTTTC